MSASAALRSAGFVFLGACMALPLLLSCDGDRRAALPDLVVVTVDTLRADRLGCYGYFRDTSPAIDALAAESVVFEDVVTTMSTTLPAHVSLWESRYPLQTGVVTNDIRYNREPVTPARSFAEILRDLGYETAAFVSAAPLRAVTGVSVGFDTFDEPPEDRVERRADRTTDRAIAWLRGRASEGEHRERNRGEGTGEGGGRGRPFFLWIHYYDPHEPYAPPPGFEAWPADASRQQAWLAERGVLVATPPVVRHNDGYDGEVRFTDSQVGRLIDALRDLRLFEDAAFVLTSDHGEGLGQHGEIGHGWIYNEQLRIPWILKLPVGISVPSGERRSGRYSILDVVPTLVRALDLRVPARDRERFEGIDALREVREWSFAQRTEHPEDRRWGAERQHAILGPRWKFLSRTDGPPELYDLPRDPHESTDLAPLRPAVLPAIEARLHDFVVEHGRDARARGTERPVDERLREQLRALGYLGD